MKIVQQNAMRLILQEQPLGIWFLGLGTTIAGFVIFIVCKPPIFLWGGVLIAIAGAMMSWSATTTCTFDKINNQLTVRRQHFFSQRVRRHAIHQIAEVRLRKRMFIGTPFYHVSLIFASGQQFPITQSASTDWHARKILVEQIRSFLGKQPS